MTVELKPETERLVHEEIELGHIQSIDELIVCGVRALREKRNDPPPEPTTRKRLYDLLTQPPFAGSELTIERQKNYPRHVELS